MLRSLLLALAAFLAFGTATAGSAQDIPQVISPLRVETDPVGVNLVDGKLTMATPVLSVPGAPNLRFDRVQNAAPYVSGRRWGSAGEYPQSSYSVHTGTGTSDSFRCVDDVCTPVTGGGSNYTINANIYRQSGTGAVWRFNLRHVQTNTSNPVVMLYYASSATYPNGEVITYSYQTASLPGDTFNRTFYRPIRMSSNMGYFITISYQPGELGTMGWNSPAQATLYSAAAPATPLQQLTYNGNTITDLGGRVYQCSGCQNSLGADIEVAAGSFRLPGEGANALEATALPTAPVVASATRDGVSWSYAYGNLRYYVQNNNWLYDSLTVNGPNGYRRIYGITQMSDAPQSPRNVVSSVTDEIGRTTSFQYDFSFRPIRATYPEGNAVLLAYDDFGNLVSQTTRAKPSTGLPDLVQTARYPTDDFNLCNGISNNVLCYRPQWFRDAMGRQTDYTYNSSGQLIEQTDPADASGVRRKTYITYEASTGISRRSVVRVCGLGTTCGTANEIRTEYEYFRATLLPTVERRIDAARGITLETRYTYDNAGRRLSEDGPLPGTDDAKFYRYDLHGRRTWEIGPRGTNGLRTAIRTTYRDADDRVVAVETGTVPNELSSTLTVLQRTDTAYDAHRRPMREALSSGGPTYALTQRTFDERGQLTCEARRMNAAVFATVTSNACALGTQGSFGADRITRNLYDAAGQLTQVQRAYLTARQQNYVTYTYTGNGKRATVTDANGNRASMTYDGYDRQIRWNFPSPSTPGAVSATDYEAYGYDAAGNRTSLRRRDGRTITYQYDNLNRATVKTVPASVSGAAAYSVFFGYDMGNRQLHARFGSASGTGITNAYDNVGRLISSTSNMGGFSRTLSYLYDAGSRRSRLTFPDGNFFSYSYDGAGRLTGILENGVTTIATFDYDNAGRLASRSSTGAGASYGYDAVSRPSSLGTDLAGTASDQSLGFSYNPVSQIVTRTSSNDAYVSNTAYNVTRSYTVNGLNQYLTAGPATFAYDGNGNLRSDGSTSYVYDSENRLVSASGATNASIVYDPLGRLFQTSGGAAGTTQFLYDGDELVAEYNSAGTLLRRYAHGTANDDPVVWYEGAGLTQRRSLFTNNQGSIVAAADSSGKAIAINAYDSWGIPNAANLGRFGFTGQVWIAELGMWHYKARIYSPTLGRFLQTDPVGYQDQINLYAYVGNDPVNHVDPTGLATDDEIRRATQTLNSLKSALRAEINAADEPAAGSRMRAQSDTARIGALRTILGKLETLNPAQLADMRVNPPAQEVGQGLTGALSGARAETIYSAVPAEGGGVTYERASQTSRTGDSAQGTGATTALADGHKHDPGGGREYPGVGDPGNVLTRGIPHIVAEGRNSNAIGWNGTQFKLTNVQGTMPSWESAPQWVRDTFAPW